MGARTPLVLGAILALFGLFVLVGAGTMATTPDEDSARDRAIASTTPACAGNETYPGFDVPTWQITNWSGGFTLSVNETSVGPGEPIRISLRNVARTDHSTGVKSMYVLQKPHALGWETVTAFRGQKTDFAATSVTHEPETGFDWTFRANASGFSKGRYVICESLSPGVYRFVYVGGERPIAVRFQITEREHETLEESP